MATLKYLDDTGVALLWAKIKAEIAKIDPGEDNMIESISINGESLAVVNKNVDIGMKINNQQLDVDNNTVNLGVIGTHGAIVSFDPLTNTLTIDVPVDTTITDGSTNPVDGNAVYDALALKADLASPAFTGNPTATTQDTNDDSTKIATTAFVKAAIQAASIGIQFEIVTGDLPATGDPGTIYLKSHSPATRDIYDEYVWVIVDSTTTPATYGWEKIGTTQADLSNYVKFSDLVAITSAEIDQICT